LATFQQQRERLYRAGPGKYTAVQDVEPQQPGDLALKKGMPVEGRLVTLAITYLICRPLAKTSKAILPNDSK